MTALEIKSRLIKRIKSTENEDILQELYNFLNMDHDDIEPLKLSNEQKSLILKGQKDIKSGHFLSNDQANHEIDTWLKE